MQNFRTRYKLKFNPDLCLKCETYSCLTECMHLNYGFDEARQERHRIVRGDHSRVFEECMACYGCEEY